MYPLPHPWPALVLALAAYRLTRLAGWDDVPPIARIRAWLIGERWIATGTFDTTPLLPGVVDPAGAGLERLEVEIDLPGKQPSTEVDYLRRAYDRPLLAHLIHCPFCVGWWISLAVWGVWALAPTPALWIAAPFALSGFVGLVSKNLDP